MHPIIPQILLKNLLCTRHHAGHQDYHCELFIWGFWLESKGTARVWQPLAHYWRGAAQSYEAPQNHSPSLQARSCQKWHLEWDQIDEMKVTFLSLMEAGIWVEDGEDSLYDCLQTQAPRTWAGVRDTLAVPPARQKQGINTQGNAFTQSLLSPFPITQLPPGRQRTKGYCLSTPCFMGERRWLPGDGVLPWKQPFPWDCISWQKVTAGVGDWLERLWKAGRGALPLGCSLQNVALEEVSPSTHSILSTHKQLPQEDPLSFSVLH